MTFGTGEARESSRKTRDGRQGHNRYRAPVGAKMRVTSESWDGEKVILRDQGLDARNVEGRLHISRKSRHHDEWDPSTTRIARAQA